jgi:hypothetical protein
MYSTFGLFSRPFSATAGADRGLDLGGGARFEGHDDAGGIGSCCLCVAEYAGSEQSGEAQRLQCASVFVYHESSP